MYAVVSAGGHQYKVAVGDVIEVNRLAADEGVTVEFDNVLLVGGVDAPTVGTPTVPGMKVLAKVVGHTRGNKIIVFKYKPKVRYRRKQGHRQLQTKLEITGIEGA